MKSGKGIKVRGANAKGQTLVDTGSQSEFVTSIPADKVQLKEYQVLRHIDGRMRQVTMTLDDLMDGETINKIDQIEKLQDLRSLLSEMAVPIYISQTSIKYIRGSDFFSGKITMADITKWRREDGED